MGSDRPLVRRVTAGVVLAGLVPFVVPGSAAHAATDWWVRAGLAGVTVTAVLGTGADIDVQTPQGLLRSSDGGATFMPLPSQPALTPLPDVNSAGRVWVIDATGQVLSGPVPSAGRGLVSLHADPGAPGLGAGAHLIAAPAAYPGIVVAVATDGVVWRRTEDGHWARSLLLLPSGGLHGVPRITAVAAFTEPLTGAIYLSTDGYSVLLSTDGGDDWIRAGPGLPDAVFALDADPGAKAVWAGTSDGLWVHHLQSFPAPPVYQDTALLWRWIGIVAIAAVAGAGAAWLLLLSLRRRTV